MEKKINDNALNARTQEGKVEKTRLRVVDDGMKCQLVVWLKGEEAERVLHARRGGIRTMNPETALRYARDLGNETVEVELKTK